MGKGRKAALAIIIVIILVSLSYYYFFILPEDDVPVERAPDFEYYDLDEFLSPLIEEVPRNLSELRGSVVLLTFTDYSDAESMDQNNVTAEVYENYPDVDILTVDALVSEKGTTGLKNIRADYSFNWSFTFDSGGTIREKYDIVTLPTVIIIGKDGYGTFKAERVVEYAELSTNLDSALAGSAERINVGQLPGVKKAPDFELTDVNGEPLNLKDYRGKVLLLDFMSINCVSCKQAEKVLKDVYKKYDRDELEIVSIDIEDTEEEIRDHWDDHDIEWRVARDPGDMALKYHVTDIVHLVLIDKKGYLVYEKVGAPSKNELQNEIDDAIAGRSAPIELVEISFYLFAVLMGIGTFFSPCSFPMLPGYMSYYLQKDLAKQVKAEGAEKEAETEEERRKKRKASIKRAMASGTISAFGIVLVFTLIGVLVLLAGTAVKPYISQLGYIVGIILLVLGALMLTNLQYNKIIQPFQNMYRSITEKRSKKKEGEGEGDGESGEPSGAPVESSKGYYAGLFTYGVGYGAAAAACTAPLFIAIVTQALLQLELLEGIIVLFLYIISMVVLMIAVTVAIAMLGQSAVQKLASYTGAIKKFSGIVLIIVGIYLIVFYYLSL
ncbi:MAG: redoxin domain-containing protein [Thermoplasmata archaeon]|nr:MAG: redoxin domain-containing protein [Thermoplasmata archaeon]